MLGKDEAPDKQLYPEQLMLLSDWGTGSLSLSAGGPCQHLNHGLPAPPASGLRDLESTGSPQASSLTSEHRRLGMKQTAYFSYDILYK